MVSSTRRTPLARRLHTLSLKKWGPERSVTLLGRHPVFVEAQDLMARFARIDRPVLLQGESGVGKELFARSLYLLSDRRPRRFVTVNCAEFQNEQLLGSELFGHTSGAFTGATGSREGLFERASGGILFLDEVSELSPRAQATLLRVLGEGEIRRLGDDRPRLIDVRIVAATNRDLREMLADGRFRGDLYHRLCGLQLDIPPLRRRGDDWRLLFNAFLERLHEEAAGTFGTRRRLSAAAEAVLSRYRWPGNVRELQAVVDVGFCLATDGRIEPHHVETRLTPPPCDAPQTSTGTVREPPVLSDNLARSSHPNDIDRPTVRPSLAFIQRYEAMATGEVDFWAAIHQPYLDRELNREQVRAVIARGLQASGGSFVRLLPILGVDRDDYGKFMDFLRHHRLKPRPSWGAPAGQRGVRSERALGDSSEPGGAPNKKRPASGVEAGR